MIYSIYKPVGWTSFDVVNKIRFITKEKKVGHGGTLDPFAEGVLIIGTGKDTKRLQNISNNKKSYEAKLVLGAKTDTLDNEGKIIENKIIPDLEISFTWVIPVLIIATVISSVITYRWTKQYRVLPFGRQKLTNIRNKFRK